jgi:hypothetical protein
MAWYLFKRMTPHFIPAFAWGDSWKTSAIIASNPAEIRIGPGTSRRKDSPLHQPAWSVFVHPVVSFCMAYLTTPSVAHILYDIEMYDDLIDEWEIMQKEIGVIWWTVISRNFSAGTEKNRKTHQGRRWRRRDSDLAPLDYKLEALCFS